MGCRSFAIMTVVEEFLFFSLLIFSCLNFLNFSVLWQCNTHSHSLHSCSSLNSTKSKSGWLKPDFPLSLELQHLGGINSSLNELAVWNWDYKYRVWSMLPTAVHDNSSNLTQPTLGKNFASKASSQTSTADCLHLFPVMWSVREISHMNPNCQCRRI